MFEGIGDMLVGPGTTEPVFGVALSGMPWDEPGIHYPTIFMNSTLFETLYSHQKKAV